MTGTRLIGWRLGRLGALCLAWGCWSAAMAAEAKAWIFVYAQRESEARSWRTFTCDGEVMAEIRRGSFFAFDAAPGRHMLEMDGGVPMAVEAVAGRSVFVRVEFHHAIGRAPIPALSKVGEEMATTQMRFLSYVPEKRVRSAKAAKADPRAPEELRLRRRNEP